MREEYADKYQKRVDLALADKPFWWYSYLNGWYSCLQRVQSRREVVLSPLELVAPICRARTGRGLTQGEYEVISRLCGVCKDLVPTGRTQHERCVFLLNDGPPVLSELRSHFTRISLCAEAVRT